jgi:hypothetical protein
MPARNIRMRLLGVVICCSFAGTTVQGDDKSNGPFGLTWGISAEQTRALGVQLIETPDKRFGTTYAATKLPKVISDVENVYLTFGYDDQLWRVAALSRTFDNDPSGNSVRARYNELVTVLGDKYGRGRQEHYQDTQMWKASTEFVMGVKLGRSHWYTNFETKDMRAQLSVVADNGSTSQWRLIMENKALKEKLEAGRNTHERNAL